MEVKEVTAVLGNATVIFEQISRCRLGLITIQFLHEILSGIYVIYGMDEKFLKPVRKKKSQDRPVGHPGRAGLQADLQGRQRRARQVCAENKERT